MAVQRSHDNSWLAEIFSQQAIISNLVATLAGIAANCLVDSFGAGHVSPFDLAACLLVIGGVIIHLSWEENGDESSPKRTIKAQFGDALACIRTSRKVMLLGGLQVRCFLDGVAIAVENTENCTATAFHNRAPHLLLLL
jgi:MFS transporter, MFS domain-containing protein family, molybdate-anion transporter